MKETDLYQPVKNFLEKQGYQVKGELQKCDVVARRKGEGLVVVELKLVLNLKLILQAIERLSIASFVYIAIPENTAFFQAKTNRKHTLQLLKMLGIGLLLVNLAKGKVFAAADPGEYKPKKNKRKQSKLLKEFQDLVGDPNQGGSASVGKKMTLYRQKALDIAQFLQEHGPTKASEIKSQLQEEKARQIMYNNVYGWFERLGNGIYSISSRGLREYKDWRP
ncbi:MAG: DUF2161 family putative PD-(D/E)XK-type phosphodiesterase [Spirochaetota bacterium]